MMQHNNTANTHRSLMCSGKSSPAQNGVVGGGWGGGGVGEGGEGCSLIRVCSLIRSNTYRELLFTLNDNCLIKQQNM